MGFKDVWLVMGVKEYLMTVRNEFNVQDYAPRTLCSESIICLDLFKDPQIGNRNCRFTNLISHSYEFINNH